jgi:hypothetical protein
MMALAFAGWVARSVAMFATIEHADRYAQLDRSGFSAHAGYRNRVPEADMRIDG